VICAARPYGHGPLFLPTHTYTSPTCQTSQIIEPKTFIFLTSPILHPPLSLRIRSLDSPLDVPLNNAAWNLEGWAESNSGLALNDAGVLPQICLQHGVECLSEYVLAVENLECRPNLPLYVAASNLVPGFAFRDTVA